MERRTRRIRYSNKVHAENPSNKCCGNEQNRNEGENIDDSVVVILQGVHQLYVFYGEGFRSLLEFRTALQLFCIFRQDPVDAFRFIVESHHASSTGSGVRGRVEILLKVHENLALLVEHIDDDSNFFLKSVDVLQQPTTKAVSDFESLAHLVNHAVDSAASLRALPTVPRIPHRS